jgi:hypothetical protein
VARKKAPIVRLHTTIDLAPVTNLSSQRWAHEPHGIVGSAEDVVGHETGSIAWPEAGQGSPIDTNSKTWR